MNTLNTIISEATAAGFLSYGNFRTEDDNIQCETLTCTEGDYSGEVIDIYYDYYTGNVTRVDHYSQFPVNHPHHAKLKYNPPVS